MNDERLPIAIPLSQRHVNARLARRTQGLELRISDDTDYGDLRPGRTSAPRMLSNRILAGPETRGELAAYHHDERRICGVGGRKLTPHLYRQAEGRRELIRCDAHA